MKRIVVAAAQLESHLYDESANLNLAETVMSEAARKGARAIVFPEMFLTGYLVWEQASELAEDLSGPTIQAFAQLARKHRMFTVSGFPGANPGSKPFNAVCVVEATGEVLGTQRKVHLFAKEPEYFAPGSEFRTFQTSVGYLGVLICYDLEFSEGARMLALEGSEIALVPTANMEAYQEHQRTYAKARSMENWMFVVLCKHRWSRRNA